MVHEHHALAGRFNEGRRPHDPQSFRRHRRLNPDASDQRLPGSHQRRTLPSRQAKSARIHIHQPHDHVHRAVSDRWQAQLLEDQPTCRLTHSFFKKAKKRSRRTKHSGHPVTGWRSG
ncbi:MAG: hypothetical protein VB142_02770 [Burkholderia sp.]